MYESGEISEALCPFCRRDVTNWLVTHYPLENDDEDDEDDDDEDVPAF
jgi:hypothetical protein